MAGLRTSSHYRGNEREFLAFTLLRHKKYGLPNAPILPPSEAISPLIQITTLQMQRLPTGTNAAVGSSVLSSSSASFACLLVVANAAH